MSQFTAYEMSDFQQQKSMSGKNPVPFILLIVKMDSMYSKVFCFARAQVCVCVGGGGMGGCVCVRACVRACEHMSLL